MKYEKRKSWLSPTSQRNFIVLRNFTVFKEKPKKWKFSDEERFMLNVLRSFLFSWDEYHASRSWTYINLSLCLIIPLFLLSSRRHFASAHYLYAPIIPPGSAGWRIPGRAKTGGCSRTRPTAWPAVRWRSIAWPATTRLVKKQIH